ncbi:hypothetical protein [Reichenbachiella versicolor]|uniref:hypothetical protein n=1 Tax=Reichenbachiella versicolor TaxID=1821036 RepID=UPI000D6E6246|nr:hypothetical protein [Reichenbachiella versicolor]
MKFYTSLLVFVLLCLIHSSCSEKSKFQGVWVGVYSGGGDKGTWYYNISRSGEITGKAKSSLSSSTYDIKGEVGSDGFFIAHYSSAKYKGVFNGKFEGDEIKGVWSNLDLSVHGSFSGKRKE